jgi:hypothetical protein
MARGAYPWSMRMRGEKQSVTTWTSLKLNIGKACCYAATRWWYDNDVQVCVFDPGACRSVDTC